MSEHAARYYQARAERLGIEALPGILDGQPVPLMDDGQRLSLHRPDQQRVDEVTQRYADVLHSVDPFVTEVFKVKHPDAQVRKGAHGRQSEAQHLQIFVAANLLPKRLKTGRVTDVTIEAIAHFEVPPSEQLQHSENRFFRTSEEDNEVYLLTSGALFAGRPLGYVACLTTVGIGQDSAELMTPKYISRRLKTNEALAKSGLLQSRAVRTAADRESTYRSLNASKRDGRHHGRRW